MYIGSLTKIYDRALYWSIYFNLGWVGRFLVRPRRSTDHIYFIPARDLVAPKQVCLSTLQPAAYYRLSLALRAPLGHDAS